MYCPIKGHHCGDNTADFFSGLSFVRLDVAGLIGLDKDIIRHSPKDICTIVGMAAALKANYDNLHENETHLRALEKTLLDRLNAEGVVYTRNGGANTLPGIMSLAFPGKEGEAILHRLDLMGISISTGSAYDIKNTEISNVLKAIRPDEALALGTVRIFSGQVQYARRGCQNC